MIGKLRRLLIGETLPTTSLKSEKFNVLWGLPVLSSDAISSVAYAVEEILIVLVPIIGILSYKYVFYAALCIVLLLFLLVFSYRQTIDNYPCGGGSYIVAKDNLGTIPGLVAGAALSIDYVLTVAVSISSGTAAITSAVPSLYNYRVLIALAIILFMTIGNLRGLNDSSKLFGVPTYLFIFSIGFMILFGIFKVYALGYKPAPVQGLKDFTGDVGLLLFLKAFSQGCTALTGVEAVSNGIPNFREPAQKNAKRVLTLLALVVLFIFGGISYLATLYQVAPKSNVTVISQIAMGVFGSSFMFYVIQVTTALILIMAANTAFADLPLLLSLIAKDGYAPRQFTKRGKRLSFSNGIILLAFAAALLVIIFECSTHKLIPLYAVGVFISFTLSQTGMFTKWLRSKEGSWRHKAFINGFGALVTFVTAIIIAYFRFAHGAWFVCVLIPTLVFFMTQIKRHYNKIASQLKLSPNERPKNVHADVNNRKMIILVESLNKSFLKAYNYSREISNNVVAFHISSDKEITMKLQEKWKEYGIEAPLVIRESPYRDVIGPLREYIKEEKAKLPKGENVTIVLTQFVITKWWHNLLHNQTGIFIKNELYKDRDVIVTTVPYIINE